MWSIHRIKKFPPRGTEKPAAFASPKLSATEQTFSTVEKEALSCVWTAEKRRTYLWGWCFTRTDHQALTMLLSTKGIHRARMSITCWSAVIYRPGSLSHAADCLSHLLLPVSSHLTSDADLEMVAQISAAMSSLPVADFHSACSTWPELLALLSQIQSVLSASIKSLAPYYNIYNELSTLSNYVLRGSLHHVQWDLHWLQ